jgi:type VI secretion system secreted protein Hcp
MAAFIKFDGIDGESKAKGNEKWSDLQSYSQAMHRAGGDMTGTTRRRGSVQHADIQCNKVLDKSSPKIAEAVSMGKVFPKVEIALKTDYVNSGRETFLIYTLKNVLVTSYAISGTADGTPLENFSLNFEEIKMTYTEMDEKGTKKGNVDYEWKVQEGSK